MGLFDRLFRRGKEAKEADKSEVRVEEEVIEQSSPTTSESEESLEPSVSADESQSMTVANSTDDNAIVDDSSVPAVVEIPLTEKKEEEIADSSDTQEVLSESFVSSAQPDESSLEKKYDRSLEKTRRSFSERFNSFLANFRSVDEDFFEELEETLILSDVGVDLALEIAQELRQEAKLANAKSTEQLREVIISKMVDKFDAEKVPSALNIVPSALTVMLFIGVNGAGKTTTIGKLAARYRNQGKKVLLAAADTFRAGAINQLKEWALRADVAIVAGKEGGDPASVVFDALKKAQEEHYDFLLVDTAGRLQNKDYLMKELAKIGRIIKRELPEAPQETILTLDATTGQNAIQQAKDFTAVTPISGIALTKLDGSARGGIVLSIVQSLKIPVKLVGLGEKIEDLADFDEEAFIKGLFKGVI